MQSTYNRVVPSGDQIWGFQAYWFFFYIQRKTKSRISKDLYAHIVITTEGKYWSFHQNSRRSTIDQHSTIYVLRYSKEWNVQSQDYPTLKCLFLHLVVLVWKNGIAWYFCVNYIPLDMVAIPRHVSNIIKKLLDNLDVTIFTKLDFY